MKTDSGAESFTEVALEPLAKHNEVIQQALEGRQLASLTAKYLEPYLEKVAPDGKITYQLHQLRGNEYGTITGRYSSSRDRDGIGINIQQVSLKSKQPILLQRWDIRELFIPPPGRVWGSADASQIELRFLAHHAAQLGMVRLAMEYNRDPWIDFHKLMVEWTGIIRSIAKNVTFAKQYGGGVDKIAAMCGVSHDEGQRIVNKYDNAFPEARRLLKMAENQAKQVGYVRDFMGRRFRFLEGDTRTYAALNRVFQGGAASAMKVKMLESYRARKKFDLTLRFTVHDEFDGCLPNEEAMKGWDQLLNEQTLGLEVPIMWKCGTGPNWSVSH